MAELTAADVAVVIPTRERWDILGLTLSSLSRQSVAGFETIVVVDGTDQVVPPLEAGSVLVKRRAGPAAARNAGAASTRRPVVVFLGDDTIPAADLVERHLGAHLRHPEVEAAAVGFVGWHDSVSANKLNAWLEWSGTQSWYDALGPEAEQEVSHWHFYTSNVSLKRELLFRCGGFDEDFPYAAFEDIECGLRLSRLGLRLYYEPKAVCRHLHDYDWAGLERRFASMALSERLMVEKHPDVAPGCLNRMKDATVGPALPVERFVDTAPSRLLGLNRLLRHQANRHYHRRLSPTYQAAWERAAELCDLRRYLGERYDSARLVYGSRDPGEPTTEATTAERSEEDRLFDLARRCLSDVTGEAREHLRGHLSPGSEVLEFGCGIGSDGLRLAGEGFRVHFADQPGLPLSYLKWRLADRGLRSPVYEVGVDTLPPGLDAVFCLDGSGPEHPPGELLGRMAGLAPTVVLRVTSGMPEPSSEPIGPHGATVGARLAARQELSDGSRLLVYRGQPVGPAPPG
ncbi:MAG TPA: glycosyltransferase family 2 protein [Acidimicrobiales bacterium]|nr:glycosyltransferase family 2 protein [Acidimicrobiales bacterium]